MILKFCPYSSRGVPSKMLYKISFLHLNFLYQQIH
uniref:Uncharacterized protein n=1 Tax=Rhizophora mucronata TaxID=61149 RepID=A0A2P2NJ08_RHIMU